MWSRRSDDGWRGKASKASESSGVHLIWPSCGAKQVAQQTAHRQAQARAFREGFLVAMTGTIRHEAARRSYLFGKRLEAHEPADPPRII